jgi:hypothetical protein
MFIADETLDKIEIKNRLDKIEDLRLCLSEVDNKEPNPELVKLKIISEYDYTLLEKLEERDSFHKSQKSLQEDPVDALRASRYEALRKTDWTQLPDSPLSTKEKMEYRSYRDYLRKLPTLIERKQILKLEVMSFEEWVSNKPIY